MVRRHPHPSIRGEFSIQRKVGWHGSSLQSEIACCCCCSWMAWLDSDRGRRKVVLSPKYKKPRSIDAILCSRYRSHLFFITLFDQYTRSYIVNMVSLRSLLSLASFLAITSASALPSDTAADIFHSNLLARQEPGTPLYACHLACGASPFSPARPHSILFHPTSQQTKSPFPNRYSRNPQPRRLALHRRRVPDRLHGLSGLRGREHTECVEVLWCDFDGCWGEVWTEYYACRCCELLMICYRCCSHRGLGVRVVRLRTDCFLVVSTKKKMTR